MLDLIIISYKLTKACQLLTKNTYPVDYTYNKNGTDLLGIYSLKKKLVDSFIT